MKRKVYLTGEMEQRFGSEFSMYAKSYSDIIRCIDCNRSGFRKYLMDCHNKGVDFVINFADKYIEEEDLFLPLKEGDVTIMAIPAGSGKGSDIFKIVAAIFLLWASGFIAGFWAPGTAPTWATPAFMMEAGFAAEMVTAVGIALLNSGIQGLLAPDPAVEEEQEDGYLYTGSETIVIEGDPVPVLYGELRVPGQPVSMALSNISESQYIERPDDLESTIYSGVQSDGTITPWSRATLEETDAHHSNTGRPGDEYTDYSDIRLKENIKPLGQIYGINIYSWDWNEKGRELGAGQLTVGVIAQEIVRIKPDAAWLENGYYVVDYNKIWDKR